MRHFSSVKFTGNTAHWTLQCEGMSGQGTMTYRGDSYEGTMVMNMAQEGESMQMSQRITGKRLGDCRP
jgi:hypothetical protein